MRADPPSPAKSELAETALHCMCTLLVEVTHFNFRINLMSSIVAALSRKSWDQVSILFAISPSAFRTFQWQCVRLLTGNY